MRAPNEQNHDHNTLTTSKHTVTRPTCGGLVLSKVDESSQPPVTFSRVPELVLARRNTITNSPKLSKILHRYGCLGRVPFEASFGYMTRSAARINDALSLSTISAHGSGRPPARSIRTACHEEPVRGQPCKAGECRAVAFGTEKYLSTDKRSSFASVRLRLYSADGSWQTHRDSHACSRHLSMLHMVHPSVDQASNCVLAQTSVWRNPLFVGGSFALASEYPFT